ncbi:MAG: tyrosine-type recombinase/integrase [Verrucomicrobiales bacterium]|nr:tyrosine-type recombinase/integrase [Verrucomicrobiales bacterium]
MGEESGLVVRPDSGGLTLESGLEVVPAVVAQAGQRAAYRFLEFFAAQIRNRHTRRAYHRNVTHFFSWAEYRGLYLDTLTSVHVAAYIEEISPGLAKPSVKQHLAAIRMLFDWLMVGGVIRLNPADPVRGPKHVVKKGRTPVLTETEAKDLFASIDTGNLPGLRDRALIAVLLYSFARIEAALGLNGEAYYCQGKRWWLRLHEKNGKVIEMPCHHKLEEYLDAYVNAAGLAGNEKAPLFQSFRGRSMQLTGRRMQPSDAWRMIRRRAAQAGIATKIGCHSFRATGITNYLQNGGKLETAQRMAGHESARTTGLYDRRDDDLSLDEIERISI